jgi:Uma2 family endonuclease
MSTRSGSYLEAIDHLPAGALLVLPHVGWEDYEQLLEDLAGRPGVRVSYDDGRLQIMTPSAEHEEHKEFILRLAQVFSEERSIRLETRGSATWKRRTFRKGAEPDTCFYVTSAHRIIGRRQIDLETDPPPDVVVEIDMTNESLSKFPIYAAFGVPEIWRYDGTRVQMYALTGTSYTEAVSSAFFTGLTCSLLLEFLDQSKTIGQTDALKAFRQRLQAGPERA